VHNSQIYFYVISTLYLKFQSGNNKGMHFDKKSCFSIIEIKMFACKNIFMPNFNRNVFFRRKTMRLYVAEQKFYFCSFQCYNMSEKLSV